MTIYVLDTGNATRVCNPVMVTYFSTFKYNPKSLYLVTFTEVGPIKNKTIFDVPPQCK